jgi:hypothetical protein
MPAVPPEPPLALAPPLPPVLDPPLPPLPGSVPAVVPLEPPE